MHICVHHLLCQRPYSIRTRIKTSSFSREAGRGIVRDHIPLEQGLRPLRTSTGGRYVIVRDHIPLEQGLRQICIIGGGIAGLTSETIFH